MWLPAEHELLLRIIEAPHDTALRFVLADLLAERGEPLAELIVIQCQLEKIRAGETHGPWLALKAREHELLTAHAGRWHQQAAPFASELTFRRGLPEVLYTKAAALLEDGGLTVAAPILELEVSRAPATRVGELFALPLLARIERLALLGIDRAVAIALPPFPKRVRRLRLMLEDILELETVLRAGWLQNLEQLELSVRRLEPEALYFVEQAPMLKRFALLDPLHGTDSIWQPALLHLLEARPVLELEWHGQRYTGPSLSNSPAAPPAPPRAVALEVLPVQREAFGRPRVLSDVSRSTRSAITLQRLDGGGLLARPSRSDEAPFFEQDAAVFLALPRHPSRVNAVAYERSTASLRFEACRGLSLHEVGLPLEPGLALRVAADFAEALARLAADLTRRGLPGWPKKLSRDDVWLGVDGTVKVLPFLRGLPDVPQVLEEDANDPLDPGRRSLGCPPFTDAALGESAAVFTLGTVLLHLLTGVPPIRRAASIARVSELRTVALELRALAERPLLPSMLDEKLGELDGLVERALTNVRSRQYASVASLPRGARASAVCDERGSGASRETEAVSPSVMSRLRFVVLFSLAATACDLGSLGTGGTGGGSAAGGGSAYNGFASGFVFVNRTDGHVYVTDATNVPTPVAVTSIPGTGRTPSLSHDGKVIVFAESTADDSGIVTVPSQGGQATTILLASANPGVTNVRTPVFTPDGLHIVFSYDYGGSSAVGQVNIDGTSPTLLAGASSFAVSGASLYPDGSAFLAAAGPSTDQLTQLVGVVIASDTQSNIASTLGLDAENLLTRVVVSPDGTMATFDARVSSGSSRIFVMNLSTLVVAQVTDEPGAPGANDTSPCWVGSTEIAYSSTVSGADATYVIAASSVRTAGMLQVTGAADPWYGPN